MENSISKIKNAEEEAEKIIKDAKKNNAKVISDAKRRWEVEVEKVKAGSDNLIKNKVEISQKEAGEIKAKRVREIEEKVSQVTNAAEGKVNDAVDFVVGKVLEV